MKTFSAEAIEEYLRCSEDGEAAYIITQLQAENAKLRLLVSDATLALDVNGSPENAHRIQTKLITIIKGK